MIVINFGGTGEYAPSLIFGGECIPLALHNSFECEFTSIRDDILSKYAPNNYWPVYVI